MFCACWVSVRFSWFIWFYRFFLGLSDLVGKLFKFIISRFSFLYIFFIWVIFWLKWFIVCWSFWVVFW